MTKRSAGARQDHPRPVDLDGDPDAMFPLRSAADAGKLLGRSDDWMNNAAATGLIPYVDFKVGRSSATGKKQRMFRADHLRQFILDRTIGGE
jgi:hypothetical protein